MTRGEVESFLSGLNIPIHDVNKDTEEMADQCGPVGQRRGGRAMQQRGVLRPK